MVRTLPQNSPEDFLSSMERERVNLPAAASWG